VNGKFGSHQQDGIYSVWSVSWDTISINNNNIFTPNTKNKNQKVKIFITKAEIFISNSSDTLFGFFFLLFVIVFVIGLNKFLVKNPLTKILFMSRTS
jgi:hypothetical protein